MPQRQDKISKIVKKKTKKYGFEKMSCIFYEGYGNEYNEIRRHSERVSLKSEKIAKKLGLDKKRTFISGLLHDIGKFELPINIFDDHPIDREEYRIVKYHSQLGYEAIREIDLFIAGCVGLHHAVYKGGYGIETKEMAQKLTPKELMEIIEIATIISIVDFADAYTYRNDGKKINGDLKQALEEQYPYDGDIIKEIINGKF